MSRSSGARERYLYIDALRGLAAMAVVLFHVVGMEVLRKPGAEAYIPALLSALIEHGHLGVHVFFAISGFVIAYTTQRFVITPGFVGRFVVRRSIRLDPTYWATILVVLARSVAITALGSPQPMPEAGRLLAHAVYLQSWLGYAHLSMGLWTLCIEFQFYVVFVVLMGVARRLPGPSWAWYLALPGSLAFASLCLFQPGHSEVKALDPLVSLLPNAWMFFIGAAAYWALSKNAPSWFFWVVLAPGLVRLAVDFEFELAAAGLTATSILVVGRLGKLATWSGGRVLQFLGRISYSLYLIHFVLAHQVYFFGFRLIEDSFRVAVLLTPPALALALFGAWLLYRWVEAPSQRLAHRVPLVPGPRVPERAATIGVVNLPSE